jgi:hypothetical protein
MKKKRSTTAFAIVISFAVIILNSIVFYLWSTSTISTADFEEMFQIQENLIQHSDKKLVVFNALGKVHNLVLVEHARRNVFQPDEWECVAFMFAKENRIPDENEHFRRLQDDLQCIIPRTPGIHWGDFLQFMIPLFTSKFDYIALVLDDIFMPIQGKNAVSATKLIERMKKYDIDVIQPGIVGDTRYFINRTKETNMERCIVEVPFIETYAQIFTKEAWNCYYSMLNYDGSKGWCYALCFKAQCPKFKLAVDFSMQGWHMDRLIHELPTEELHGTNLTGWKYERPIRSEGYRKIKNPRAPCKRLSNCINPKNISYSIWNPIECGKEDE